MKPAIKTGSAEEFFEHGRAIARLADEGSPIIAERIILFEDSADLARILVRTKDIDAQGTAAIDCDNLMTHLQQIQDFPE